MDFESICRILDNEEMGRLTIRMVSPCFHRKLKQPLLLLSGGSGHCSCFDLIRSFNALQVEQQVELVQLWLYQLSNLQEEQAATVVVG